MLAQGTTLLQATKALRESLETLRVTNLRAEPAVRALKERERLKEDMRLCQSKRAWLRHKGVSTMLREAERVRAWTGGEAGRSHC